MISHKKKMRQASWLMKIAVLLFFVLFASVQTKAQYRKYFELGLLLDRKLYFDMTAGVGRNFKEKLFVSGAVKWVTYSINPMWEVNDDPEKYQDLTNIVGSLLLDVGVKYRIPLTWFDENSLCFGIAPELHGHFNPWVPQCLAFRNEQYEVVKLQGDYAYQFAYTAGLGIFLGDDSHDLSLNFKVTSIDLLKTLRTLDTQGVNMDFPEKYSYMLSLSFSFGGE